MMSGGRNTSPLAQLRVSKGLTQQGVAEKVKRSHLHVLRIERGQQGLTEDMAEQFAKLYDVDASVVRRKWQEARRLYLKTLN